MIKITVEWMRMSGRTVGRRAAGHVTSIRNIVELQLISWKCLHSELRSNCGRVEKASADERALSFQIKTHRHNSNLDIKLQIKM